VVLETIVCDLEVVQIHNEHSDDPAVPLSATQRLLQTIEEQGAVR
jgi:hypothetical protein